MPAAAVTLSQHDLEVLACRVADQIIARQFGEAAKLIDELADAVREVREVPPPKDSPRR